MKKPCLLVLMNWTQHAERKSIVVSDHECVLLDTNKEFWHFLKKIEHFWDFLKSTLHKNFSTFENFPDINVGHFGKDRAQKMVFLTISEVLICDFSNFLPRDISKLHKNQISKPSKLSNCQFSIIKIGQNWFHVKFQLCESENQKKFYTFKIQHAES